MSGMWYGKGQDFQGAASAAPIHPGPHRSIGCWLSGWWAARRALCVHAWLSHCLVVVGAFAHEMCYKGVFVYRTQDMDIYYLASTST